MRGRPSRGRSLVSVLAEAGHCMFGITGTRTFTCVSMCLYGRAATSTDQP